MRDETTAFDDTFANEVGYEAARCGDPPDGRPHAPWDSRSKARWPASIQWWLSQPGVRCLRRPELE